MGRLNEAARDLDRALALDPWAPRLLLERAYILRKAKDYLGALAALDLATLYGEHEKRIWFARGRLHLYRFEDPQRAIPDLARAVSLDPDNHGYWYNYGLALYRHQDCRAQAAYTRYQRLCAAGKDCKARLTSSAATALDYMAGAGICPDPRGTFGPAAGGR
jgi:tetratricopeptide (TPR) repeat protein